MKTKYFLTMITTLLVTSCEFVTEIDENDITRAQDADLKFVVSAAEVGYMVALEGNTARISSLWSGYFFGKLSPVAPYYSYDVNSGTMNYVWDVVYASTLKNLRIAQNKATAIDNKSVKGICQVMEASMIGTTAALWGDIPFSEAADVDNFPNPSYEPQEVVIDKLIVLLDSAIINLASSAARSGDFLYTGATNAQWIAAANSVKARLLLYKKDYVNALLAANSGIQLPANDLLAKHGTTAADQNLYYAFQIGAWTGTMTAENTWLGNLLNASAPGNRNHAKTIEAARLAKFYSGSSVATYMPNIAATGYFAQSAPFPLHTANETKLIAAECLSRTGDFTNALAKLNEHRANLRAVFPTGTYVDFVAADFNPAGIENVSGVLTPDEALLREILEEKYVCLYGQVEGFNELRRNGNAMGLPPNTGTQLPERFLYALTEINVNASTPNPIPGLFEKTTIFQ